MQAPKIFNLGEIIVAEALISDCPLTKQQLSEALNTTRPSIWRYDRIAYWNIEDYKQEYPLLPKDQWLIKKTQRDTEVPLTPYQVWVLAGIQICFKSLRKKDQVEQYVKSSGYVFSKSKYDSRIRQLIKAAQASYQETKSA